MIQLMVIQSKKMSWKYSTEPPPVPHNKIDFTEVMEKTHREDAEPAEETKLTGRQEKGKLRRKYQ